MRPLIFLSLLYFRFSLAHLVLRSEIAVHSNHEIIHQAK